MAKYNKPTSDGPSSEEKALDLFAEMMIEKIQSIDKDWKKPWFTDIVPCFYNHFYLRGQGHQGTHQI